MASLVLTPGLSHAYSDGYIVAYNHFIEVPEEAPAIAVAIDPREHLRAIAGENFYILDRIATCESKWRMVWNYMYRVNPLKYTAYGFFQITRGTAVSTDPSLNRLDPIENVELAVKLYNKRGTNPWNESRGCWGK